MKLVNVFISLFLTLLALSSNLLLGSLDSRKVNKEKQGLSQALGCLAKYMNCMCSYDASYIVDRVRLPFDLVQSIFLEFETVEHFKQQVGKVFAHVGDEALVSQFRMALHDYVLEQSKGKRWEIAVACYVALDGEKAGLGKLKNINVHIRRPHSNFSREFDLEIEKDGNPIYCECKNIDWSWVLNSDDSEAVERLFDLKKQLDDQRKIARQNNGAFMLISKRDIPDAIEDEALRQILDSLLCVYPKNAVSVCEQSFIGLYDLAGPYYYPDPE